MNKIEKFYLWVIVVVATIAGVAVLWNYITIEKVVTSALWILGVLISALLGSIASRYQDNSRDG
jgi:hypothetical protein